MMIPLGVVAVNYWKSGFTMAVFCLKAKNGKNHVPNWHLALTEHA